MPSAQQGLCTRGKSWHGSSGQQPFWSVSQRRVGCLNNIRVRPTTKSSRGFKKLRSRLCRGRDRQSRHILRSGRASRPKHTLRVFAARSLGVRQRLDQFCEA